MQNVSVTRGTEVSVASASIALLYHKNNYRSCAFHTFFLFSFNSIISFKKKQKENALYHLIDLFLQHNRI